VLLHQGTSLALPLTCGAEVQVSHSAAGIHGEDWSSYRVASALSPSITSNRAPLIPVHHGPQHLHHVALLDGGPCLRQRASHDAGPPKLPPGQLGHSETSWSPYSQESWPCTLFGEEIIGREGSSSVIVITQLRELPSPVIKQPSSRSARPGCQNLHTPDITKQTGWQSQRAGSNSSKYPARKLRRTLLIVRPGTHPPREECVQEGAAD
jgi:hypothetical protein